MMWSCRCATMCVGIGKWGEWMWGNNDNKQSLSSPGLPGAVADTDDNNNDKNGNDSYLVIISGEKCFYLPVG